MRKIQDGKEFMSSNCKRDCKDRKIRKNDYLYHRLLVFEDLQKVNALFKVKIQ